MEHNAGVSLRSNTVLLTYCLKRMFQPMLRKSKGHGLEYLDLAELVSLLVDAEHHLVYDPCLGPSHEGAAVTLCEPSTASVKLRVSIKQNR